MPKKGGGEKKITALKLARALAKRGLTKTARFVLRLTDDQLRRLVIAGKASALRLLAKAAGAPEEFERMTQARNGKGSPPSAGHSLPFVPAATALPAPSLVMSLAR